MSLISRRGSADWDTFLMSGRDSGDWVKDRYASNLYRSAFLSNRLQTSLLMARTVAVMASRAANISTEERRTFDRFEAPTRKEPSPGTFAFGSMYSETMRSEERRVGKECRCWGAQDDGK